MDNSSFSGEISNEKIEITTNISPNLGSTDNNPDTDERKFIEIGEFNIEKYTILKEDMSNKNYSNIYKQEKNNGNFTIINNTEEYPIKIKKEYKIDNKLIIGDLKFNDKSIYDFSNLQDGVYSGKIDENYITTENGHNWERIIYKGGNFNITVSENTFKGTVSLSGKKYVQLQKGTINEDNKISVDSVIGYVWSGVTVTREKNISGTIVNGKIEGMNVDGEVLGRCLTGNEYGGKNNYMDWNVRLYIPNGTTHYVNRPTMYFK